MLLYSITMNVKSQINTMEISAYKQTPLILYIALLSCYLRVFNSLSRPFINRLFL